MGRVSDAMLDYLADSRRFAAFFNGCIKKWLKSGGSLNVLAIENQNRVDFTMPWRHMNYDSLEYGKQIKTLRLKNKKEQNLQPGAEYLCGLRQSDRLAPVFTICLYHGEEKWQGPRSLRDMMDFGEDRELWESLFSDYCMQLVCLNEIENFSCFESPLKELFEILACQSDRPKLQQMMEQNPEYRYFDSETAAVIKAIIGMEPTLRLSENEEGEVDMCTAMREWLAEEQEKGIQKGIQKGRQETIKIIGYLHAGYAIADIAKICQCEPEVVEGVKSDLDIVLK